MKSDLSKNLKELRVQSELTQQQVADKIHISQRAYAFYETGEREPKIKTLINLAELYKVPIDVLVGRYKINDDEKNV